MYSEWRILMNGFFDYDGPFFTILNKLSDLIILNVLWILCCIPIVTIGASTTAMFSVTLKMANKEEPVISKSFFRSFKENFRQSTVIWLILLFVGLCLSYNLYLCFYVEMGFNNILLPVAFLVTAIYLLLLMWVFPLQAKFINKIRYTMKNALILGIGYLPYTVLFVGGIALLLIVAWNVPALFPVWLLFGCASLAYGYSFLYMKVFRRFIKVKEAEAASEESDEATEASDSNPDTDTDRE